MNDIKWPGSHKQHVKLFHTYSCECTRGATSMAAMRSARQHKKKRRKTYEIDGKRSEGNVEIMHGMCAMLGIRSVVCISRLHFIPIYFGMS